MATLERHPSPEYDAEYGRIREALSQDAGIDLSTREVVRLVEIAREQSSIDTLSDAMARMPAPVDPAVARAIQAGENIKKQIETEFGLLTSAEVAGLLGSSANRSAVRSLARDMRARGELLAIRRLNKYLYPGFQFDRSRGQVLPVVKPLLQIADERSWEPEDVVMWLCAPTTYFVDESRPVDHISRDPDLVLNVAKQAWGVQW
ncbi:hypothetical protein SAMN04489806_1052 [Paramicrobacterium humi]|uniref:Uncharacterized protein n=1 Tax=Paramicrobacterium humi TaxID=640635 RepID=A0A1H4K892_9MICO|nr:hypothetical protein [Microbacterium humi]SEB54516.1 hypothetical protein SAMN04489806_1052 [Microbacterium humi]